MAVNLRERAEADLSFTLEGQFNLPCQLIDPDGNLYPDTDADPDAALLKARVDYDKKVVDMETGEELVVGNSHVTLRRSSLSRIPLEGEAGWKVRLPETPSTTASLVTMFVDERSIQDGKSIGMITLYLTKAVQA